MDISYESRIDLPCKALHELFFSVGWSKKDITQEMWDNGKLVGCVRVLSDRMFRSVIYDLAVLPAYQNKGIGKELVGRCRDACPNSEWLVETDKAVGFYQKIGFTVNKDCFLTIPSKWL